MIINTTWQNNAYVAEAQNTSCAEDQESVVVQKRIQLV